MTKQEQIYEIKDCIDSLYGCDCAYYGVEGLAIAETLYNAGYRRQSKNMVEVVRCESCKHYYTYYHQCKKFSAIRACDDFCSFAERKEETP